MTSAAQLGKDIAADRVVTRAGCSRRYAVVIRDFMALGGIGHPSISLLNKCIEQRWSPAGLEWIKKAAWKIVTNS